VTLPFSAAGLFPVGVFLLDAKLWRQSAINQRLMPADLDPSDALNFPL
jgi:hypothetical protein